MFCLGDGVSMERVNTSIFLISEEGDVSALNATGSSFLECLLKSQDKKAAVAMILDKFDAHDQDVFADCSSLLEELVNLGLVVVV